MVRTLGARLTYADYAAIPSDGQIWQIVDGEVYVTPAPTPFHQRASKRLQRLLEAFFEETGRGEVFNAPIDLILSDHDVMQPDLVVVTDAASITRRGIEAPPALVVEVLSPSSIKLDRDIKARRLAGFGVPHYWVLDPDARTLECYRLEDGVYVLAASAAGDEMVTVQELGDIVIDLGVIWRT
jgi:Uma2 family endonuclease